ncbi:MAG: type I-C CRISPR-associated protein Cas5 [Anaerolineales bacterium]|nr:type I-C CRISPR-associated protein Cas5 [Anaerolineales bacterium]
MGYGIKIRVSGDYALFTRPEMKVERVSYDVITPSAARGIIEAVYWKPAIRWWIDKIHVLKEIKYTSIKRNEVGAIVSTTKARQVMKGSVKPLYLATTKERQQRASLVLKDVDYVIEAHFEVIDKQAEETEDKKHYNIILRRLRDGQQFHAPCLGTREFGARVELIENGVIPSSEIKGTRNLGWMLYDFDFANKKDIKAEFFEAIMIDGVIDLTDPVLRR